MATDDELLTRYVRERDATAFRTLVDRHLGLVYHAALRQCHGDRHRAQDVAQSVFVDLARKAHRLTRHGALVGWLYTSTRYAALQAKRTEMRRQAREREACRMSETEAQPPGADAEWENLKPLIDDALHQLSGRQREVVLLRFFEQQSLAEVGRRLAISEDAARMHVNRALEKLRALLAARGVQSTSGALGLVLLSQAGEAAPSGLGASIAMTTLSSVGAGTAAVGLLGFMSAAKIVTAVTVIGLAGGIIGYRALPEPRTVPPSDPPSKLQQIEQRLVAETARANAADADNAKLLDAIRAARPEANPTTSGLGWLTSDRMENRGTSTPRNAFESLYWAQFKGDANALADTILLSPAVRSEAQEIMRTLPEPQRSQYLGPEQFAASVFTGTTRGIIQTVQITREDAGATVTTTGHSVAQIYGLGPEAASDPNYRTLFSTFALKNGRSSETFALFQNTPTGWRWAIPPRALTSLWKATQPKVTPPKR